ncbi:MAG: glycosyltransferase family 4 protein [Nitrospiraceae bacterium]|nr:glycosyltransferase family 4 protein [Nitrospiraceae bacterium]MDA8208500.1 glycosyltransferase family 4 protein [Actinomycetota bacterium]
MSRAHDAGTDVLVVCQHFWPEAFRINDICDYFVERGQRVSVLCGLPNYPGGKLYEGYGVRRKRHQLRNGVDIVRALEIPRGSNTNPMIFLNYMSFPIASLLKVPAMVAKRPKRVFVYQLSPVMMAIAGILVARLTGAKLTMYVLDLWPENLFSVIRPRSAVLRRWLGAVSNWHYRQADTLIALSDSMKERLMEVTGLPAERILVAPQACESVYETRVVAEDLRTRFAGSFNVVIAGNISPAQSFETVLDAAALVRVRTSRPVRWIVVGDGMSRRWLEGRIADLGLQEDFVLEGHHPVEEMPRYFDVADVLVGSLVRSDLLEATVPAKVLSYIAAGKPVVLAMDGEAARLVGSVIGCGLVGPAEDALALAENILAIEGMSQEDRRQMGLRGEVYHMENLRRELILDDVYKFVFSDGVANG